LSIGHPPYWKRVLANYCAIALALKASPPFTVEIGALELRGIRLGYAAGGITGPIHNSELKLRRTLNDTSQAATEAVVEAFMEALFDLAGLRKPK